MNMLQYSWISLDLLEGLLFCMCPLSSLVYLNLFLLILMKFIVWRNMKLFSWGDKIWSFLLQLDVFGELSRFDCIKNLLNSCFTNILFYFIVHLLRVELLLFWLHKKDWTFSSYMLHISLTIFLCEGN